MRRIVTFLSIFLFASCVNNSKVVKKHKIQKCVVDSVIYVGQRSSIESDIYWDVYTTCGIKLQTKQPYKYIKGDTITFEKFYETRDF